MEVPAVTLAVPYHSGRAYLEAAVESVRGQDDPHWQLLVVDDSGTPSDLAGWLAGLGDARVRFLGNPHNLGMVPCWNRCLDEARTDLVTLLHADDLLRPDYVRCVRTLAAAHPGAAALFTGAKVIGADGRARRSFQDDVKRFYVPRERGADGALVLHGERSLEAVMRGNFLMCPTLCWRLSVLRGRRFDPRWKQAQDLEFTARLLLAGEALAGTDDAAYLYRRHDANATARQTESLLRFQEEFAVFDGVAAGARERGWTRVERVARAKRILRLHLTWRVMVETLRLRWGVAARTLRFLLTRR